MAEKILYDQDTNGLRYDLEIYLDGKPIPWQNINSLTIRESVYSLIPRIDLSFNDDGLFTEYNPVTEGQVIEIIAALNKETSPIINQKFFVLASSTIPMTTVNTTFTVNVIGLLNRSSLVNGIFNKSYSKSTFSEVVEEVARRNNLPSDIRINSKDNMNWYQLNQTDNDFVNDSIYRSYISNNDVPFCYIDRNGKMIFTSLKYESKKDSKLILTKDNDKALSKDQDTGVERYFTTYSYSDKSGYTNTFNGGYGIRQSYYDGKELKTKDFTDSPFSEMTPFKNKRDDNFGEFVNDVNIFGTLNNVYDSYFNSIIQNEMTRTSLLSTSLVLNAKPDSYNLFDKINIEIKKGKTNNLLQTQSGDYLIGGIVHNINKGGRYNQMLVCFRDGMNANNSTNLFTNPLKEP